MKKKLVTDDASIFLGKAIARARQAKGLTRIQLGKMVNEKEQDLHKYERGVFMPLPLIERIGEALDAVVEKKIIRRISNIRKRDGRGAADQSELISYYDLAFPEVPVDDPYAIAYGEGEKAP